MKQNKIIAVTGGIGSGKSTVAKILEEMGFKVFSCDEIYSCLTKDEKFLEGLCRIFGDIRNERGNLDRKKLSSMVFGDSNAIRKLDDYTHPEIYKELFNRAKEAEGLCFCEVPLLFESNAEGLFDGVIVVLRDKNERVSSAAKRDNLPESAIEKRIASQFDYDNGDFTEYYVIHNQGDLVQLKGEICKIIDKLK